MRGRMPEMVTRFALLLQFEPNWPLQRMPAWCLELRAARSHRQREHDASRTDARGYRYRTGQMVGFASEMTTRSGFQSQDWKIASFVAGSRFRPCSTSWIAAVRRGTRCDELFRRLQALSQSRRTHQVDAAAVAQGCWNDRNASRTTRESHASTGVPILGGQG